MIESMIINYILKLCASQKLFILFVIGVLFVVTAEQNTKTWYELECDLVSVRESFVANATELDYVFFCKPHLNY